MHLTALLFVLLGIPVSSLDHKYLHWERFDDEKDCLTCRVITVGTLYVEDWASSQRETRCAVIANGYETDDDFQVSIPPDIRVARNIDIESGKLVLSVCRRDRHQDSSLANLSRYWNLTYEVLEDQSSFQRLQGRNLNVEGTLTVAIISVSTPDSQPTHSAASMANALFDPSLVNLRTQYEACSFGKLKLELADKGVFDVQLSRNISSFDSAESVVFAAQEQLRKRYFLKSVRDLGDKVLFCVPPGTGEWAASAGVNHWRVQLNNDWCVSLTGTVHEVGHTIGLLHSNAGGEKYGDRSGMMGSGHKDSSSPRKCFNGYHSHQLGWYGDRTLSLSATPNVLLELATFVDYNRTTSEQPVLINIVDQYFLQYNIAKSFNIGTEHERNKVIITKPTKNGTERIAGLRVGDEYRVPDFLNEGVTLIVQACERNRVGGVDTMILSIALNRSLCNPSSSIGLGGMESTPSFSQRVLRYLLTKPIRQLEK